MLSSLRKDLTSGKLPFSVLYRIGILAFFLLAHTTWSQVTRTWVPAGGGDWANASNWSPAGVPAANDDVIIPATHTGGIITNVPNITLRDLLVQGSGTCTFQASAAGNTLTVTRSFSVVSGKTLVLGNMAGRMNFTLASTATGTVNGTVTLAASGATDRFFTNDGNLSVPNGGLIQWLG